MEAITLAGRPFRTISNPTARNDVFNRAQVSAADLGTLHMYQGEDADRFARRILDQLSGRGDVFMLLGGMMIPAEVDDLDWTPDLAAETAAFLGRLTDPADKRQVHAQIASVIIAFLQAELTLLLLSPRSLAGLGQQGELVSPGA